MLPVGFLSFGILWFVMWIASLVLAIANSIQKRRHRHIGSYSFVVTIAAPLIGLLGLTVYSWFYPRPVGNEPLGSLQWLPEIFPVLAITLGVSIPVALVANIALFSQPREKP